MLSTFERWFIWFIAAFYAFYQYGIQIAPSLKVDYLKKMFQLSDVQVAAVSISYFASYMIFQIPMGYLIDRFDVRKIMTLSAGVFALGSFVVLISNVERDFALYLLGRFIMGAAATAASIGPVYLANVWLNKESYNLAVSIGKMMGMLGVLGIGVIFSFLLTIMNWSQLIFANCIFTLFLACIYWIFIRDAEEKLQTRKMLSIADLKKLFKNKDLWLCAFFVAFMFANIVILSDTWRIHFLQNMYHLPRYDAAVDNGFTLIGVIIGAPLLGYVSRYIQLRLLMMYLAIGQFILLFICHYFIMSLVLKLVFYFAFGFCSAAYVLGFILVRQLVNADVLATALGCASMSGIGVNIILLVLTSKLLEVLSGNYILAMTPVVIISFMAMLIAIYFYLIRNK